MSSTLNEIALPPSDDSPQASPRGQKFRRAVLRGMGIVLPPLLTIVIFLWIFSTVRMYVLQPVKHAAREAIVWWISDIRESPERGDRMVIDHQAFVRLQNGQLVPAHVLAEIQHDFPNIPLPVTGHEAFQRYVEAKFLQDIVVIPVFLLAFLLLLYLLGKSIAAGFGAFFWNLFERGILRLPIVRSVYSSSKQVTDFMFNQGEPQFLRVVAVEYPRERLWTLGLVTGEGLMPLSKSLKSDEPMVSVMLPCSPIPITGYVVVVSVSKTVPLDITIDQALQFILSCGVISSKNPAITTNKPQALQDMLKNARSG